MGSSTVEKVKLLWKIWDVRVLMLTSLIIQALLTLFAPLRKRCANTILKIFMWMLYLAADSVALFIIGLISSNRYQTSAEGAAQNAGLLAFWASFLLLHLGGPDTITALALEDNELWRRHALQLATQVAVTVYVFGRSVHQSKGLLIPTILMFVDGCIKYIERTCALYYASMGCFRDSHKTKPEAGPNYAMLMEEYSCAINGSVPAKIQGKDGPSVSNKGSEGNHQQNNSSHESTTRGGGSSSATAAENGSTVTPHWYHIEETDDMVGNAYKYYNTFKGLIADSFLSLKDRDESRKIFLGKPASETFRILEIELNFVYDVFYTKVFLLHRRRGCARILCFLSVIASMLLFWFKDNRKDHRPVDVVITFALLVGALVLDITSTVMFLLSDWCIIIPSMDGKRKILRYVENWLPSCSTWVRNAFRKCWSRRRWSQSISKYNLLNQCLKDPPSILDRFCISSIKGILKNMLIEWLYVHQSPIDSRLGDFIMGELQRKAKLAVDTESINQVCSARGNLVFEDDYLLVTEYLRPWTVDVDYDESLLTWHLATDFCYWTRGKENDVQLLYRQFSKDMSDYMAYLFLRQKELVSPEVGTSDVRSEDTCAEAKKFMNKRLDGWFADAWVKVKKLICLQTTAQDEKKDKEESKILRQCCQNVLEVKAEVKPIVAKGDKSKSVFFDACRLAKQLNMFGGQQWVITAKVWVELLSYAAVRCAPRSHVAELSNGGQFITIVWLLMAHLGLGERFRQNRGFGYTKLIIPK